MNKKQVLIACQIYHGCKKFLDELLPNVDFHVVDLSCGHPDVFDWNARLTLQDLELLKTAEVLILDNVFVPDALYSLPNLKFVQCTFAGLDGTLDRVRSLMKNSGGRQPQFIACRFTGQSFAQLMFEYCVSFIIAHERDFLLHIRHQRDKDWNTAKNLTKRNPRILSELSICVLGVGSIGCRLIKLFKGMGCKTLAFGKSEKKNDFLKEYGIDYYSTDLIQVLKECDCVINLLPHSPETTGLLNGKFSVCLRQPLFINIGRGSIISEADIIESLDSGLISGAVLDVFQKEPLPPDNRLWSHPKVYITPHVSAQRRLQDLAAVFVENYRRFHEQSFPLLHQIDWNHDY